jgi:hypothetical protein
MLNMEEHSLPDGAKSIENDEFAIVFGDDKIVFVPKGEGREKHYTLHAGFRSGVMDLHETAIDDAGRKRHRTLYAVRRDDLSAVLRTVAPIVPALLRMLRPLRLGWLKHRKIGIARGIDPVSNDDIAAITRKKQRRLTFDADLWQRHLYVPEYLEELYDFPDGNFALFHCGRQIGIGFKKTDGDGNVRLFWVKRRDLMRLGYEWQDKVIDALRRFAISPERYAEYPFLSP